MIYSPNYTSGGYTGDYVGGEIISKLPFQYGSFECGAIFAHQNASQPAFWLFGGDGLPCPPGGYINEIDIAELLCEDPSLSIDHVIHKYYPPADCSGSVGVEKDKHEYFGMSFDNNFHLFKCVWTPDKIDYYVDGVQTHQVVNSGQEWFPNLHLELRLSQQILDPIGAVITPQTSYFDYVRVKQFFLAPVITSPNSICSTGIATMDVDPLATNISWQLTPSYLFTTSTGSGKTVNIVSASGAIGVGKITYTFQISGETFTAYKDFNVGPPISYIDFTVYRSDGVLATKGGSTWLMCANTTYHIYMNNHSSVQLSNYIWKTPTGWYQNYTYQNMISVNTNSSPGGPVEISAYVNDCNGNYNIATTYMGTNYSCGAYFMAFTPNPATEQTTIELSADGEKMVNDKTEWEMEVYDNMQSLKEKKIQIKGNQTKLNTTNWKDGVYIVRAKIGEEIISEKLLIKH